MMESLPADASTYQTITEVESRATPYVERYLDLGRSPVITVSEERVGMFHGRNRDARPPQLFDCHERLVQMGVLGHQMSAKVHYKQLGVENIRRAFCDV